MAIKEPRLHKQCCKRVRLYYHNLNIDGPSLQGDKNRLMHWQRGTQHRMLIHHAAVAALREMAIQNADRMEEEASKRAQAKFAAWATDRPAAELGRHHR